VTFEERLSAEMKAADASFPGAPLTWSSTIARGHRRRASFVLALAGASASAAALLIAAGVALSTDDGAGPRPARPGPTTSPAPSPTVDGPGYNLAAVEPAVLEWLDAIAAHDYRSAWQMLGPATRSKMGSFQAFESVASSDYRGIWGRWAGAAADLYQTPAGSSDEGSLVVVTMVAEVAQEGSKPALDAQTLVVGVTGDRVRIEPEIGQYPIQLITPQAPQPVDPAVARTPVSPDVVFEAEVTKTRGTYFDVVDLSLGHVGKLDDRNPAGLRRTTWNPSSPLPAGRHILTVYSISSGGPVESTAVIFTVR
jgi:hypothetical protein